MVRGKANPKHFGFPARLKRARKAAGLSAAGLSKLAGMGAYTVNAMETTGRLPRLAAAEALARAMGLSPGWLAYGQGEPEAQPAIGGAVGLADRLRSVRAIQGLSCGALATKAGLFERTIVHIEKLGGMPSLDTLEQIAVALGVSPAWLAFGEGDRVVAGRKRGSGEVCSPTSSDRCDLPPI